MTVSPRWRVVPGEGSVRRTVPAGALAAKVAGEESGTEQKEHGDDSEWGGEGRLAPRSSHGHAGGRELRHGRRCNWWRQRAFCHHWQAGAEPGEVGRNVFGAVVAV